jgi:hypothetical protein
VLLHAQLLQAHSRQGCETSGRPNAHLSAVLSNRTWSEPELFALAEPEPECNSGSGFGSGAGKKWIDKSRRRQKIKNEMTTFLVTMMHLSLKRQDYVLKNFCGKTA